MSPLLYLETQHIISFQNLVPAFLAVMSKQPVIRKLMQNRELKLLTSEYTENDIYIAFNDANIDNEAFMDVLLPHYQASDELYPEYLNILSNQIFG